MLKSLLRIFIALVIILGAVAALLVYANSMTNGRIFGRVSNALQNPGNTTQFYLTGGAVKQPWLNGYDLNAGYYGSGAQVKVYDNWRYSTSGQLVIPKVSLQRQVGGGKWETVVADVPFAEKEDLTATAPAYKVAGSKKTEQVKYRFISEAYTTTTGKISNTSYSGVVTVTYENQAKYTGLAKTIYTMMRQYCPNSAVHVSKNSSENANEAGAYTEGMLLIEVSPKISSYSTAFKRTVALHECTHEREFLNYGGTAAGWQQMTAAVGDIFKDDVAPPGKGQRSGLYQDQPFNPVEHAADCGAYALNPAGYLGYGGYCNPAELKAGKALLLGKQLG